MADLYAMPLFGLAITVIAYAAALQTQKRIAAAHPLLVTTALLIAFISLARVPITAYKAGGDLLTLFLGPATVALAVPLYKRLTHLRRNAPALLTAIALGGAVAIGSSWLAVHLLKGAPDVERAMLSRSVTTPISVGIATELHASRELAATFTVVSGLLGAVFGPIFLRTCRVTNDTALGLAIGTAAHGIGTSSVIRHSHAQGAAAGLAMALNGIFTSLLMIPLYPYLRLPP